MKVTIVLCLVFITAISAKRDPKLFFVSTLSTTSTCYTSSGTTAIASCSGRKKRSIVDGIVGKDDETIAATSQLEPLEPSIAEPDAKSQREGKFLLYWLTTTTTSTSTTFA